MAVGCLLGFLLLALFAPLIANDLPLYLKLEGESYYPAFSGSPMVKTASGKSIPVDYMSIQTRNIPFDEVWWPLVPFAPNRASLKGETYPAPGTKVQGRVHLLGGNGVGEDVLSGIIHGTRVSLRVGFLSMVIALLIGLCLGLFSGYFGNKHLQVRRGIVIALLLGLVFAWFYAFSVRKFLLIDAAKEGSWLFVAQLCLSILIFILVLGVFVFLLKYLNIKYLKKPIAIPVDHLTNRFIDLFSALPKLVIILSFAALVKPSIYLLVGVIGLTGWVGIARFTRAEVYKIRQSDFVLSCRLSGMSTFRILFKHLLPNVMGPALVAFAFGVGGAVLAESSLSFLNIGIPKDVVTWGKLLAQARGNFNAWWLVWFPGAMIFLLILSTNTLGEYFKKRLNPETVGA